MECIAIFAALQWECQSILRNLRQVSRARSGHFTVWHSATAQQEVWLVKTGIGLQQAGVAARELSEARRFDLFLSTGCAGALAADLVPGDIALATAVVGTDPGEQFDTDATRREHACRAVERAALRATLGPVLCSPQVLVTAEAKRAAAARGPVAVEMEGVPIAACAARAGIPFISVRAILDTADTELRHAGKFIDPQSGAVKPFALAGYLATHPSAVSDLLAMQRMMKAAQTSMQRFFAAWLSPVDR